MADGAEQPRVQGTDMTPSYNISSSSRIRLKNEDASVEISTLLNTLGYGLELRQKRRECYKDNDIHLNTSKFNTCSSGAFEIITVGSKAEGLSRALESDRDALFTITCVKCIDVSCDVNSMPENTSVFRMDTQICYPGHCILLLERGFALDPYLVAALCDNGNGNVILGSDALLNLFRMAIHRLRGPFLNERAGPSLPFTIGPCYSDFVFALRCQCPIILQRWAARSRHWPPPNIVEKVVSKGAFLTPVGFKGSENKHVEWRICFNTGETELVFHLNDTQVKVYVLLKMIAKDVLKPRHKEITSYMLKNIVLWIAEKNPQPVFHVRSLFFWLREALLELRTALSTKTLPYYMIPERNLMAACGMTDTQNQTWKATLTDMIDEGPEIIRRLPKIRQAIISHPEPLLWFNARKLEVEIMLMAMLNSAQFSGNFVVDVLRNGFFWRILDIVNDVTANMGSEESNEISVLLELLK